jgi:hypothetical protein
MLNESTIGQIGLVMGIAVGVITLGIAMYFLGTSMSFDLDLFSHVNNVTNMSIDIQEDIKNKEDSADRYSIEGTITILCGVILLIAAYLKYRKSIKKNEDI